MVWSQWFYFADNMHISLHREERADRGITQQISYAKSYQNGDCYA